MNLQDQKELVEAWNARRPVGTPVRYWTGAREGEGKLSKTTHAAVLVSGHTAVVWVEGEPGWITLSHVEAEQRCELCYRWKRKGCSLSGTCSANIPYRVGILISDTSDGKDCDAYRPRMDGAE